MNIKIALTAAALSLMATPAALAGAGERGEDFVYSYNPASLTTETAVAAEYERLQRAIKSYCRTSGRTLHARRWSQDCRARIDSACQLNLRGPLLAYHRAMTASRA